MKDSHKDRGKPSAMPNRDAQQQEREHGTGDTRTSPNNSTLHNAPIKLHKPRKGAGVLGYAPGTKRRTRGRTGHGKRA